MNSFKERIITSLIARDEAATDAYNFNDKVFKFASWFLTLSAIKLAAEVTHSRALGFAAVVLTGVFWLPVAYFVVGPQWKGPKTKSSIAVLLVKTMIIGAMGLWVNGRIDRIIDAIVAQHIVK